MGFPGLAWGSVPCWRPLQLPQDTHSDPWPPLLSTRAAGPAATMGRLTGYRVLHSAGLPPEDLLFRMHTKFLP